MMIWCIAKSHANFCDHIQNSIMDKRRPQFTQPEVETLKKGYLQHRAIIEAVLSKTVTKQSKDVVWEKITAEISSIAAATGRTWIRTPEEVKKKYKNLKSLAKEKIATERRSTNKSGGGPPDVPLGMEDEFENSFLGNAAFEGISDGKDLSLSPKSSTTAGTSAVASCCTPKLSSTEGHSKTPKKLCERG